MREGQRSQKWAKSQADQGTGIGMGKDEGVEQGPLGAMTLTEMPAPWPENLNRHQRGKTSNPHITPTLCQQPPLFIGALPERENHRPVPPVQPSRKRRGKGAAASHAPLLKELFNPKSLKGITISGQPHTHTP